MIWFYNIQKLERFFYPSRPISPSLNLNSCHVAHVHIHEPLTNRFVTTTKLFLKATSTIGEKEGSGLVFCFFFIQEAKGKICPLLLLVHQPVSFKLARRLRLTPFSAASKASFL